MMQETRLRSAVKSILWRVIATLNSFLVLTSNVSNNNLRNAIYMNITGLVIYFLYERVWNKIKYGKESI